MTAGPRRVAVICPDLSITGGLRSVASFVMSVLDASERYEPTLVSLATSSSDRASTRLRCPTTWQHGPRVLDELSRGLAFRHVGAHACELEWMRYRPRRALNKALEDVDLVHVVTGSPAWGLVASSLNVPVLLQVATLAEWERGVPQGGPLAARWRAGMTRATSQLDREALRRATTVLAQNRRLAAFAENYAPGRVQLFHPGTDTARFHPPAQYAVAGHLLAVGRLGEPRKDWSTLFQAYAAARRHQSDLPDLVLAGRGQLCRRDQDALAESGAQEHIRVMEDVSEQELVELYQGASMYLLTSIEEGFGLVLVEAMACGLPVIATRLHGTLETIEHGQNGMLVERDHDLVANTVDAIVVLWRDVAMRLEMRRKALESSRAFSTQTLTDNLLDTYERHLRG